jgi:hypothetical protein
MHSKALTILQMSPLPPAGPRPQPIISTPPRCYESMTLVLDLTRTEHTPAKCMNMPASIFLYKVTPFPPT